MQTSSATASLVISLALTTFGCGTDHAPADAAPSDTSRPRDASAVLDSGRARDGGRTPELDSGTSSDSGASSDSGPGVDSSTTTDGGPAVANGAFRFLTYNVAGLPGIISGSDPAVNTAMMSPLLNAYDIVVVQEDFSYHGDLISAATHDYISGPSAAPPGRTFGDGLGRLSVFSFVGPERQQWDECNGIFGSGTDCLAGKGFSVARHQIAAGLIVDVYNLHMDAGRSGADYDAREAQVRQLVAYLTASSADATVIVAGDTNLKTDDEPVLVELLTTASLTDVCRSLSCPDPAHHDRVMYRNAPGIELTPTLWQLDPRFVDAAGEDLSDHPAVGVDFEWRRTATP